MKVSTDACIQGAWTPVTSGVKRVLDIGTGTGLLSLMLAQRNDQALIEAVELDKEAALQAEQNVASSPWSDRITIIHADVKDYTFRHKFDLIICNPPFFNNSLLGKTDERNHARHTLSLSFHELFEVIRNNLSETGYVSILFPMAEHTQWKTIVEKNGWSIYHYLNIQPKPGSAPNRIVSLCAPNTMQLTQSEDLLIRDNAGQYTPEFIHLLRPFYLML
jgi:tRNA1Val (adenine37-N6)-methyltransferase